MTGHSLFFRLAAISLIFSTAPALAETKAKDTAVCVPSGTWLAPPSGEAVTVNSAIERLAVAQATLLGESHTSREHHRWQLHTLAALYARQPNMVIGFEMFPREVQPALDAWVEGTLSEDEFLEKADWGNSWRYDPSLYLPLFHFARQNRIPMIAINVDQSFIAEVREKGFDGISEDMRELTGKPTEPVGAYRDYLLTVYNSHTEAAKPPQDHAKEKSDKPVLPAPNDPEFLRFMDVQLTWDRAMAKALYDASTREGSPLVVGIIGTGHLFKGYGVPHQLKALGMKTVATAVPWDAQESCKDLTPDFASLVFGLDIIPEKEAYRPLLGVRIDDKNGKVEVANVVPDSVADKAGLKQGDVVLRAANSAVSTNTQLIDIIQRQAPGTWLPLEIERKGSKQSIVAKFAPIEKEEQE